MSRKRRKNSSGSKRLKKVMISEKFPIIAASMSRKTKRAFLRLSQKSMENRVRAVKGLLWHNWWLKSWHKSWLKWWHKWWLKWWHKSWLKWWQKWWLKWLHKSWHKSQHKSWLKWWHTSHSPIKCGLTHRCSAIISCNYAHSCSISSLSSAQ